MARILLYSAKWLQWNPRKKNIAYWPMSTGGGFRPVPKVSLVFPCFACLSPKLRFFRRCTRGWFDLAVPGSTGEREWHGVEKTQLPVNYVVPDIPDIFQLAHVLYKCQLAGSNPYPASFPPFGAFIMIPAPKLQSIQYQCKGGFYFYWPINQCHSSGRFVQGFQSLYVLYLM